MKEISEPNAFNEEHDDYTEDSNLLRSLPSTVMAQVETSSLKSEHISSIDESQTQLSATFASSVNTYATIKDDWHVHPSSVKLGQVLGRGRFGIVYLGIVCVDAMKKHKEMLKKHLNDKNEKEIITAVKMMKGNCPNQKVYDITRFIHLKGF